jgi:hypothetical protein
MEKIVDKISEKVTSFVAEYILRSVKDIKKNELWKKAVQKACEATEGVDNSFADYIIKSLAIQRYFAWITSNKSLEDVYRSFILTIAMELCALNAEKRFAVSLGMAILDNWFEFNEIDCQDIRNQIVDAKIVGIVNNRERLYQEYFLLYNDDMAKDTIRVYYPKNGENWISWDRDSSVDVKVNLSKGTEYGFCKVGFSYCRINEDGFEKYLKVAYIHEDREIFRFEHDDMLGIDEKKILWVY